MKRLLCEMGLRLLTCCVFLLATPVMALACFFAAWDSLFLGSKAIDNFFETFRWYFEKEPRP